MCSRSEFLQIYIEFSNMVKTYFSTSTKVFRADSGGEYTLEAQSIFLKSQGTITQFSCIELNNKMALLEENNIS